MQTTKKPKRSPDKRRDSPEYWEKRLQRMKLTEDAGVRISRHVPGTNGEPTRWLQYGHTVRDSDFDGRRTYTDTGEQEDILEWPLSLI